MTEWVREYRVGEMLGSWTALEKGAVLRGQLLLAQAAGTPGRGTGARGGSGALWDHGSLGAHRGCLVLHTYGTRFHGTDGDG